MWRAQDRALFIDDQVDGLSDTAEEVFGYMAARDVGLVLVAGVHLNMCVLRWPFALIELVRNGFQAAPVQDLTDVMYDPADPPYVSHEEGNRLMRGYVALFLCPVVSSDEVRSRAEDGRTGRRHRFDGDVAHRPVGDSSPAWRVLHEDALEPGEVERRPIVYSPTAEPVDLRLTANRGGAGDLPSDLTPGLIYGGTPVVQ